MCVFFEPPPAEDVPEFRIPEIQPWDGPPSLEAGVIVALERIVARSPHAVVTLPMVRAYRAGCMLEVRVLTRRRDLSPNDWWDLHTATYGFAFRFRGGDTLPDKLLRCGVRFGDGTKATTLYRHSHRSEDPPAGPLLNWWPASSGVRGGGGEVGHGAFGLWLWPLPTAEAFEFAVEWPFGGIEPTFTELDGAAIVAAAARSERYWPD